MTFFGSFFWFRFLSFLAFFRVFAVGCVISFSWCWAPCCSFFRRASCVRFCLCFLFFSGFFGVFFLDLGAGRRAALFSVGLFVCVFVCVFSSFRAFLGSFLALGAGRRAALFSVGFLCAFLFVFSLLFWLFLVPGDHGGEEQRLMTADGGLITAAGEAYDSGREAHYWGGKGL